MITVTLPLFAVGRPHISFSELIGEADVIVIADVSPSTPLGTAALVRRGTDVFPGHEYAAELRVRRVIKGSCSDQLTVKYGLPDSFMGYRPLQAGLKMVFLRAGGHGYEIVNQYYPDLPATDESVPMENAHTTEQVVEVVLRQLANVVASSAASESDKSWVLEVDYAIPAAADYFDAALKRGIANARTQQVREALQAELLVRGDLSELSSVVQLLLRGEASTQQRPGLLYAIGSWVKDRRAVPAMVRLLSSKDPATRVAASQALWHIADPSSTTALLRLLQDPSRDVRYYAVRALAEITGQKQWGPSIPEFAENEGRYLQHWKQWANTDSAR
ncbi:MAG TPA: HEAT repeat domain-containing protein [Terriglobales bacterium]|nr:HEAT repeat domain-containing protein [Terriglobales bacterium]